MTELSVFFALLAVAFVIISTPLFFSSSITTLAISSSKTRKIFSVPSMIVTFEPSEAYAPANSIPI